MNDRIRELDIFLTVAAENSFSAAARRLNCDPSTISKLVHRIEQRLGVQLFHRTSRVLKLTQEGERFLEGAQRVLRELDEAERTLEDSRAQAQGVVRVNGPLLFVRHRVAPLMPELMARHPELRFEFTLTATPLDLLEHQIDVSLQSGPIPDSSLIARRIATTRWINCAAPAYLAAHGRPFTLTELAQHNCLNFLPGTFRRTWPLREDGSDVQFECAGRISANSPDLLRMFACNGLGIARLPELLIESDLRAGLLEPVLSHCEFESDEPVFAVYPSRRHLSLRVKVFLDFLEASFASEAQSVTSTVIRD